MRSITHFITHPKDFFLGIMKHTASIWPDRTYLRIVYYLIFGRTLHLKKPKSFTEKINWLKVNHKNSLYSTLVDKYEVKKYVSETIGNDIVIPTLGVYNSFDEINFDVLPQQFVLKTTNGGGNSAVVICKDKSNFDICSARKKLPLNDSKKSYIWSREYPYYELKPRIIAEELLSAPNNELSDYKIFCLNGKAKFLFVATERQNIDEDTKFDFFDTDFNHLPIQNGHPSSQKKIEKPKNFEKMLEIAENLAHDLPNARIDLYNINGKIYFGEITLFHFGGLVPFTPDEWDYKLGNLLQLPKEN